MSDDLQPYLDQIRTCRLCAGEMSRPPHPVLQASASARIPFNDPSGTRLRDWMGVTDEEFYDRSRVAIVPMGFCFPGYDSRGADRPPMVRCAETWRAGLLDRLPAISVAILVGAIAQKWHLGPRAGKTLTETVSKWQDYASDRTFTVPHPSWRNTAWLKRNPWFEADVLPELRLAVRAAL